MGGIVKSIFGGKDKSQQREQIKANAENKALFKELAEQSSTDAKALLGSSDDNRNIAFQQTLDLLGGTIPTRLGAFQRGNVGAQNQLIAGLPMIQAAIMGQPFDMSALQPTKVSYNTDYATQTLPQFQTSAQALTPPESAQQPDLSTLLQQAYSGQFNGGQFNG